MAHGYSEKLDKLIRSLSKLPGIGPKSAERIALHLLKQDRSQAEELSRLIVETKARTFFCSECNNLSEAKICRVCSDETRDHSLVCVVEEPRDVVSIEQSGAHRGVYYVLLGALSPLEGIGPRELRLDRLIKRAAGGDIKEVILATNPNAEGNATAAYLVEALKPYPVKLSRIAQGVPVGSHLEYVDQLTLQRALEGRVAVKN